MSCDVLSCISCNSMHQFSRVGTYPCPKTSLLPLHQVFAMIHLLTLSIVLRCIIDCILSSYAITSLRDDGLRLKHPRCCEITASNTGSQIFSIDLKASTLPRHSIKVISDPINNASGIGMARGKFTAFEVTIDHWPAVN